jgi:hypothetical protein
VLSASFEVAVSAGLLEEGGNWRDQANAKWAMKNEKCKVTERHRAVGSPFCISGKTGVLAREARDAKITGPEE